MTVLSKTSDIADIDPADVEAADQVLGRFSVSGRDADPLRALLVKDEEFRAFLLKTRDEVERRFHPRELSLRVVPMIEEDGDEILIAIDCEDQGGYRNESLRDRFDHFRANWVYENGLDLADGHVFFLTLR
ncbi:MAG: hypothetical protein O3A46_09895 [Candidatus Poribacteria bacterium]|nr:hypothetical protein [Candidatus Poribacteria bacterium]